MPRTAVIAENKHSAIEIVFMEMFAFAYLYVFQFDQLILALHSTESFQHKLQNVKEKKNDS